MEHPKIVSACVQGYCCEPSLQERWGNVYHYKRGFEGTGRMSDGWTRQNVMTICAYNDENW